MSHTIPQPTLTFPEDSIGQYRLTVELYNMINDQLEGEEEFGTTISPVRCAESLQDQKIIASDAPISLLQFELNKFLGSEVSIVSNEGRVIALRVIDGSGNLMGHYNPNRLILENNVEIVEQVNDLISNLEISELQVDKEAEESIRLLFQIALELNTKATQAETNGLSLYQAQEDADHESDQMIHKNAARYIAFSNRDGSIEIFHPQDLDKSGLGPVPVANRTQTSFSLTQGQKGPKYNVHQPVTQRLYTTTTFAKARADLPLTKREYNIPALMSAASKIGQISEISKFRFLLAAICRLISINDGTYKTNTDNGGRFLHFRDRSEAKGPKSGFHGSVELNADGAILFAMTYPYNSKNATTYVLIGQNGDVLDHNTTEDANYDLTDPAKMPTSEKKPT